MVKIAFVSYAETGAFLIFFTYILCEIYHLDYLFSSSSVFRLFHKCFPHSIADRKPVLLEKARILKEMEMTAMQAEREAASAQELLQAEADEVR